MFRTILAALSISLVMLTLSGCPDDSSSGGANDAGQNIGDGGDISIDFGAADVSNDTHSDAATSDIESDGIIPDGAGGADASSEVIDSETFGGDCWNARDCSEDEYCIGAAPAYDQMGYCTVLGCASHGDCIPPERDDLFCCSFYGDESACIRESEDAVCGDHSGQQGDDCVSQSDCNGADEVYCIEWYQEQFCAESCNPRGGGDPCGDEGWCMPSQGGGLCVPEGDTEERTSCDEDPAACEEEAFCVGGFGDEPDAYAYCADACTEDNEHIVCDDDEWCQVWPGGGWGVCELTGDGEEGDSCTEDRWSCGDGLYCIYEGTAFAFCTRECERDRDCAEGMYCEDFYSVELCVPEGERVTGESCADDPLACDPDAYCMGGYGWAYNPDAYCAEECSDDPDICGDGFFCEDFEEFGHYCQPDGSAQAGEPCESALDCAAGTYCIYDYDDTGQCAAGCEAEDDCGPTDWCTGNAEQLGVCLPEGTATTGESCADDPLACASGHICGGTPPICIPQCQGEEHTCPENYRCIDDAEGEIFYCYPYGDFEIGTLCDTSEDCVDGAFCRFTGGTGKGICTVDCESNEECPDDYACFETNVWGVCLPDGDTASGESCAADRFSCGADNLCLYSWTDDAYCAQDCTGFTQLCSADDHEVCRYAGWGLNLCYHHGTADPGAPCGDDPTVCNAESICVGAGTDDAFCARQCQFEPDTCGDSEQCYFFDSGVAACVDSEFNGSELPLGGRPL